MPPNNEHIHISLSAKVGLDLVKDAAPELVELGLGLIGVLRGHVDYEVVLALRERVHERLYAVFDCLLVRIQILLWR